MSITTTSGLPAPILQSLAPGMLSVPTPNFNYIIPAEKYSMPRQGGTTMRFLRPVPLDPPVVQLGNTGIEPPSQVATREIVDAAMAFYGTSVILNEQVVIQDQDPVLSWVECVAQDKSSLIDLEAYGESYGDRAQAEPLLARAA